MAPARDPGARAAPPPRARRSSIRAGGRPQHGGQPERPGGEQGRAGRLAVGGAVPAWPPVHNCEGGHRPLEVAHDPARRAGQVVGVAVAVGLDLVPPPTMSATSAPWRSTWPGAEEGGPQARLTQRVEDSRRAGRVGAVVEREGDAGAVGTSPTAVPAGEHPDARPLAEGDDRGDVLRGQGECGAAQEGAPRRAHRRGALNARHRPRAPARSARTAGTRRRAAKHRSGAPARRSARSGR